MPFYYGGKIRWKSSGIESGFKMPCVDEEDLRSLVSQDINQSKWGVHFALVGANSCGQSTFWL